MAKITYEDKEFLNKNENIADKNKVNDTDLNQIKEVVNNTFYADYSNNNVVSDANTATETGGYYTNADTTNLPMSGSAGYLNVMKRNDDIINQIWTRYRDNQVFIRQKNTIEPSGWKEWEQLKTANGDIVYESTLTSNQSTINISGLDIVRDGGEYEITLIAFSNNKDQIVVHINNVSSNAYYRSLIGVQGTGATQATAVHVYSQKLPSIDGYFKLASGNYPSILKLKIFFNKNKISFLGEFSQQNVGNHSYIKIGGVMENDYDNMTSITFSSTDNSGTRFLEGTKVTVKKI